MDVSDKDKIETDWQSGGASFANLLMGMVSDGNPNAVCKGDHVSSSPLISMVDSFGPAPALWDNPANSQSMGFNSINDHSGISTFEKLGLARVPGSFGWEAPSQFPADSGFIERAARLSCFSSGNIADMVNPFGMNQPVNAYHQIAMNEFKGSPKKLESKNEGFDDDTKQAGSDTVNSGSGGDQEEPISAKALGTKKRKRGGQASNEDVKGDEKQNSEGSPSNKVHGENGKQNSQASDPPKEEYIHVRARRGQATNSHSLAERVRREKISERMKFLQDLVPGCSKVTGKAVMLDEIINYVQSLQRQVEFLSMKLATVNPRLDFNIESLLAKDHMFVTRAAPPTMGFSPDMPLVYQQMHPSQPTVIQPNLPVIGTSSESLKNISSQLTSISEEYKEPTPQVQNIWDDELHNVVHMGFNSNTSPGNQEENSSLPQGHTKVEL